MFVSILMKVLGWLLEKIAGWALEWGKKKLTGPSAVQQELEGLKFSFLTTMVVNHLHERLADFRAFFARNSALLRIPENRLFCERWIKNPLLQAFGGAAGVWTKESFAQVRADVGALRI